MYNKYKFFGILISAAIVLASCGGGKPNLKAPLKTDLDSASYFMGYYYGTSFAAPDFEDVNINAFA